MKDWAVVFILAHFMPVHNVRLVEHLRQLRDDLQRLKTINGFYAADLQRAYDEGTTKGYG